MTAGKDDQRDWLRPLKTQRKMLEKFAVADIESQEGTWTEFKLIGLYDGGLYRKYYIIDHFIDDVLKNFADTPVYAHFMDFDGMFLIDYLKEAGFKGVQPCFAGSLMMALKFKHEAKEYEFRNSFTILPFGLAALCDSFGEHPKESLADVEKRNYWDCISTFNVLKKFIGRLEGAVGMTTAQTAMMTFRHGFLKRKVYNNRRFDELVFNTYKGGRNEIFCFNTDEEMKAYLYDINSMYPYVMKYNPYPVGKLQKVREHVRGSIGVCHVRCEEDAFAPVLSEQFNKKSIYRNATKSMWVTTPEYEYLKDRGARIVFERGYETADTDYIFAEYVDHFFTLKSGSREKGDMVGETIAKLMLNSLYGKFGQRPLLRRYMVNPDEEFIRENAGNFRAMTDDGSVVFTDEYHRPAFTTPLIASLVTSYARLHLHKYITQLDPEILYYCDTDSLYVSEPRLEDSKELGRMSLKGVARPFYPIAPKFYVAGEDFKMKGIPTSLDEREERGLTKEEKKAKEREKARTYFAGLLKGQSFTFTRGVRKFKSAVKSAGGAKLVQQKVMKKSLKSAYDKRLMHDDYTTRAWETYSKEANREVWSRLKACIIEKLETKV